jgi:glycosyltransferase involved in cell wall biosynthesis
MVSDPDVVDLFHEMPAPLKINYHLAAYMVYREKTERLGLYYNHDRAVVHLANSHWTAEQIESSFGDIKVAAVLPGGIDKKLFHPVRTPVQYDLVYYGSKRKHKGTPTIVTAAKSLKMNGLSLSTLGATQEELAQHICSGRIFASACWHEGFNFCPLEAMACGVPVVMTDDGGSREYAHHGENALVVPPQDEVAFAQALAQLHKDQDLRLKFIERGLETAYKYNWDDITVELADIIEQRLR